MQISPELGVAIMMNNYFHDVATALLAASAFVIHAIVRTQAVMASREASLFFLRTYDQMVKFFRFALWWIIIGGIPRTVFYTSFEWANAADKLQVPALMVKHVVMAVLVIWGVYAWRRLKVKVAALRQSVQAVAQG
ncbi:hypothetical protein Geob_0060 [Geotalea daltonii FRC-32]|uniref:Uncharacterized protein n=1 Tax=Geotalea daltonii (strain DSM 22248 / JCM 15807 / FRC-32) TaxID=316067 RepID=B9M7X9_GEODF|nr:hypothetical protein [Geotalea daltonii]ACM18437.1 hypothetical protein Geob_0060 [Geotalea daltonii FRC-32]